MAARNLDKPRIQEPFWVGFRCALCIEACVIALFGVALYFFWSPT